MGLSLQFVSSFCAIQTVNNEWQHLRVTILNCKCENDVHFNNTRVKAHAYGGKGAAGSSFVENGFAVVDWTTMWTNAETTKNGHGVQWNDQNNITISEVNVAASLNELMHQVYMAKLQEIWLDIVF